MKILCYIFSLLALLLFTSYKTVEKEVRFGVKVGAFPTGKIQNYAIFRDRVNGVAISYFPDENAFLNYLAGTWPLPGEGRRNYLAENEVEHFKIYNYAKDDSMWYCPALDSLWKLRFAIHPLDKNKANGWSNGILKPSARQYEFLGKNYNLRSFEGSYFIDSNFFKILRDVTNPIWVAHYKSL
ncbi:hypothetical protein SAMN05216474_2320 [Lishizhenia tianjinensis]|uniref:Uncharacterized protein n=1 Tax=Lishizhenia tianjinensis TaxID=477690 RepID=A0A1I7AQX4_9FLAO|nr:hypothetical protein [Lishizhenia tianjinensis]SFT77297.1 hypothetical protein SAMN05216474_2320 [Lishizhenia tianjinensis]